MIIISLTTWSQTEKEAIPGCDVTVPVRKQLGWASVQRTDDLSDSDTISADGCKIGAGVESARLNFSPLYENLTSIEFGASRWDLVKEDW